MVLSITALDTNLKNMDEFTNEQNDQLKTWVEHRDEILSEISNLRSEEASLRNINKELAVSSADIESRMLVIQGRIQELEVKESERPALISKEIAFLESKKSTIESEITILGKLIDVLTPQKISLESDIEKALATFEVVKGEALLLNKIVDNVTTVSKSNENKINLLVSNLATSLEEIIEVNKKNVKETNIVIDKLPRILMELQKRGLIKHRQSIIKNNT